MAPLARRPRRSHAERTAETRGRIQGALVEAITELGFHRATSAEISRRSGVSWGAAQHHFGDKNGILLAVLVDSFNRLVAELEGQPAEGASLEERVEAFVERTWAHVGSPHYRCTFEILLNLSAPAWEADGESLLVQTLRIWNDVWERFFADASLDRRRRLALQYYTISALSGLAAMKRFEGPNPERRRLELGFLKDTLMRELGRDRAPNG
jgi:AcrR family transcriptional regulator